jgi:hypothetical protein
MRERPIVAIAVVRTAQASRLGLADLNASAVRLVIAAIPALMSAAALLPALRASRADVAALLRLGLDHATSRS